MAVIPQTLLEAAQTLLKGGTEVDHRNATSRAYYAAYHACKPIGKSLGLQEDTTQSVHRELIEVLKQSRDRGHRSLAYMLDESRRLRNQADYAIEMDFRKDDAATALRQCASILEKASTLLPAGTASATCP